MPTMLDARDQIVASLKSALAAGKPDWPVYWDNLGVPNRDDLQKFVSVELPFIGGRQASLGPAARHRRFGILKFYVAVREHSGKREQLGMVDFVADSFQTRYLGPATMKAAVPQPSVTQLGWDIQEVWIPLEVDN